MHKGTLYSNGEKWITGVEHAQTFWQRMQGLISNHIPEQPRTMLFQHCRAVHTIGMSYALNIIFLNKKWEVVSVRYHVLPGRFFVWGGWRAKHVIETAAHVGVADKIKKGDTIVWIPDKND